MGEIKDVLTLNKEEANSEKKAQVFSNFSYTKEEGVNSLIELKDQMMKVMLARNEANQVLSKIAMTFDVFSNYQMIVDSYIEQYDQVYEKIKFWFDNLTYSLQSMLEEFAKRDVSLQADLNTLNKELFNMKDENLTDKGYPSSRDGFNG